MANKRTRKAAARKRAAAAAAAPAPMDVVGGSGSLPPPDDATLAALPSAAVALRAALFGSGTVGVHDGGGRKLSAFAAAPGLARLSSEELRLAANDAIRACRAALSAPSTPPPTAEPFAGVGNVPPRERTPAIAAARLAVTARAPVAGVARDDAEAAEAVDEVAGAVFLRVHSNGEIVGDGEEALFVFHSCAPPTSSFSVDAALAACLDAAGGIIEDPSLLSAGLVDLAPLDDIDLRNLDSLSCGSLPALEDLSLPPATVESAPLITPASAQISIVASNHAPMSSLQTSTDTPNRQSSASSSEDKSKDEPGTPSGSSLWSSFGRFFNFGRSPEEKTVSSPNVAPPPPPPFVTDATVESLATSPTTPANANAHHCANCCAHTQSSGSDEERSRATSTQPRRVLRAARTLKQPPASPNPVDELGALLADVDVGRPSVPPPPPPPPQNERPRAKRMPKVKRRPRVRLVEDDEPAVSATVTPSL